MFKVGDRVRIVKDHPKQWLGCTGTVKRVDEIYCFITYDVDGYGREGCDYYTSVSCLELVPSKITSHLPTWL